MSKIHYRVDAPYATYWQISRVAGYCGAITHHGTGEFVRETSHPDSVTCKNCLRRARKEAPDE